jgi:hypothetical protein
MRNQNATTPAVLLRPVLLTAAVLAFGCAPSVKSPSSSADGERKPASTRPQATVAESAAEEIDPADILYQQTAEIPTGLTTVRALAVGAGDRLHVGGDKCVRVFEPDGKRIREIAVEAGPRCLAASVMEDSAAERLYVGMENHVEVFDLKGVRIAAWKSPSEKAQFLSIAATDQDVFVADFGNQLVWRYDTKGELKGRIGQPDKKRKIPGLTATTPYLDLAMGANGLVYVVNPRLLRLEAYTARGDLETTWGKGSSKLEDFFGCCNPTHIAVLPNGDFVTAEKGIPRIKVYSAEGKFECVVAGPRQMPSLAADLAVDHRGRVLALDAMNASVRVFERKK